MRLKFHPNFTFRQDFCKKSLDNYVKMLYNSFIRFRIFGNFTDELTIAAKNRSSDL